MRRMMMIPTQEAASEQAGCLLQRREAVGARTSQPGEMSAKTTITSPAHPSPTSSTVTSPGPLVQMASRSQDRRRSGRSRPPGRWPSSRHRLTRSSASCTRTSRTFWRETESWETLRRGQTRCRMDAHSLKSRCPFYVIHKVYKHQLRIYKFIN